MRVGLLYLGITVLLLTGVVSLMAYDISPDNKLLGEWKEVSWEFEKLDEAVDHEFWGISKSITDQLKKEISRELAFHEAEVWKFYPDGKISLEGSNGKRASLFWRLKGRGHVLKLFGHADSIEHYQIQKLTDDTMEIHFNTDLQARGIIKMTFKKIRNQ
ncbi:hypothetical protein KZP23_13395 [Echinicola marina]|uniref:hypothetical protein n=1 Tax=Echinicola marina TaxID=2859768 RepID=UPI001CF6C4FB|nr:hypothetical protein [Echinicola marina]UCS95807.1 hypothetical protein KZP23_13395 [Echinicola marina]